MVRWLRSEVIETKILIIALLSFIVANVILMISKATGINSWFIFLPLAVGMVAWESFGDKNEI